jgi:hypothetical protein
VHEPPIPGSHYFYFADDSLQTLKKRSKQRISWYVGHDTVVDLDDVGAPMRPSSAHK